ncbi:hypothetical protein CYY_004037 [Polysphondylium violaceum]|uniref:Uncharacterized protein n=1 Tax=Polysphondylium violaceum TaxID=133409 RepID=A0A8J4V5K0_9MYCE|nr:hypothetical protein CYY_004037 [Polysphondylium violaceum]
MSTSHYNITKQTGNTFVYTPNSPIVTSHASEVSPRLHSQLSNEKVVKTERVVEEKTFTTTAAPLATAPLTAGALPTSSIPIPPPLPTWRVKNYTLPSNSYTSGFANNLLLQKGKLHHVPAPIEKKWLVDETPTSTGPSKILNNEQKSSSMKTGDTTTTTSKSSTFQKTDDGMLKKTERSETKTTTTIPKDPHVFDDISRDKGMAGTTTGPTTSATRPVSSSTYPANSSTYPASSSTHPSSTGHTTTGALASDHYTEPHKPSQIKHVKGIIKEKFGHITKNQRMEENGKVLEAQFEKEKFDYDTYQHNSGVKK